MGKKCIICGEEAKFCIKGSSEYYCQECAEEHFADLSVLQKVEEEAKRLKKVIDDRIESSEDEEETQEEE